jgi:hypothetical protein
MTHSARIVAVTHLGAFKLRLTFSDHRIRDLDFEETLNGGVFEALRDQTLFGQASIDQLSGALCWPNGIDLDPDVLHGDFAPETGRMPRVLADSLQSND